jgi:hypothetical protein
MRIAIVCLAFAAVLAAVLPVGAQVAPTSQAGVSNSAPRMPVSRLTFDRWCQDVQRYPLARCDMRDPDDQRAFEDYRTVVERYEVEFMRQRERERSIQEMVRQDPASAVRDRESAPPP